MPHPLQEFLHSRRSFLMKAGQSAAAASLTTMLPIVTASDSMAQGQAQLNQQDTLPPDKKLGWPLVGLGAFATEQLIPAFPLCKKSKLVALVSGDAAKAKRIANEQGIPEKNIYNYQNYDSIKNTLMLT
ncbi:Gfo/Idh/MocA family oxidoreductase [Pontibacter silvestris]|uniref:Gfo/Idh/MocA family oxidoreductase n=1 Tax=Pontibacter silvestris TaxID=2305183 RepID=A0ABW4X3W3_9BACT|nr:Gfo/Idh/MocA family oxidoreductase [Pontibacter silvestris]MCC9134999.1 Gfo/Idh/MocA family oxidoreductase [Pontibacter silvestris]